MREILFRGLRSYKNEWVEGFYKEVKGFHKDEKDLTWVTRSCIGDYEVNKETVGQYTGFTDKNGTKVFEGDILYAKYEDAQDEKGYYEVYNEVVFKDGAFGLIGETTNDFLSFNYLPIVNETVCGNIHDNPKLLDKIK